MSAKKVLDNKQLTNKILELERRVAELERKRVRRKAK
jgi:hypothetical protein